MAKKKLPDDASRPEGEWRLHCPKAEWSFTSESEKKDIKDFLSSQRLTHFIKEPHEMDVDLDYWAWIPRKLKQELTRKPTEAHALGWALVAYVEFNYLSFLLSWGIVASVISLSLILGLYLPKKARLIVTLGLRLRFFLRCLRRLRCLGLGIQLCITMLSIGLFSNEVGY